MWTHNYEPLGGSLALSAPVAALPIVVLALMLALNAAAGWVIVAFTVAEQPFTSFTVHVYVPAVRPVAVADACTGTVFHE